MKPLCLPTKFAFVNIGVYSLGKPWKKRTSAVVSKVPQPTSCNNNSGTDVLFNSYRKHGIWQPLRTAQPWNVTSLSAMQQDPHLGCRR